MSPEEMLDRATLVFVGVIQSHDWETSPFFSLYLPGEELDRSNLWKPLRRRVQVETVLRGHQTKKLIDVYEVFWTSVATGDWNSTRDNERYLFLVRVENGHYHVVRDWSGSIFRISGPHTRLPLTESTPFWERLALMNFWVEGDAVPVYHRPWWPALDHWRLLKIERGLVKQPNPTIRVPACRELLRSGWGQTECWDALSEQDRSHLSDGGHARWTPLAGMARPGRMKQFGWPTMDREQRRILTATSERTVRVEFCRNWAREYPDDHDNGCPADRPPPATIVTEKGDVPLIGPWPVK
jgi:hypothetical protein